VKPPEDTSDYDRITSMLLDLSKKDPYLYFVYFGVLAVPEEKIKKMTDDDDTRSFDFS